MTQDEFGNMTVLKHLRGCHHHASQLANMNLSDKKLQKWSDKLEHDL